MNTIDFQFILSKSSKANTIICAKMDAELAPNTADLRIYASAMK